MLPVFGLLEHFTIHATTFTITTVDAVWFRTLSSGQIDAYTTLLAVNGAIENYLAFVLFNHQPQIGFQKRDAHNRY